MDIDPRLLSGLALTVASTFIRWRFPAVPKPVATFGLLIGLGLFAWSFFLHLPALPFLIGIPAVAFAAGAVDWFIEKRRTPPPPPVPAAVVEAETPPHDGSIFVSPDLFSEHRPIVDGRGREVRGVEAATFLLAVASGRTDGRTLRNVQARLYLAADVISLLTPDGRSRLDVQHGEYVKFVLGWTATSESIGMRQLDPLRIDDPGEIEALKHNHRHDHRSLRVGSRRAVGSLKPPAEAAFPLVIVVSADDVPAKKIQFTMNLHKLPDVNAAFSTAVAEPQA